MKTNSSTKNFGVMQKAWLIRWNFHTNNEIEQLGRLGIKNKIVDILSKRKTFEQIMDIVKAYYCSQRLSFSEKIYLEHYTEGKKRKKDFFQRAPISTHYMTDSYRNYMNSLRDNGIDHPETNKLFYEWNKGPIYISVGHNPSLEAILASDVSVYQNNDGKEVLEWDETLIDGTHSKETYEI